MVRGQRVSSSLVSVHLCLCTSRYQTLHKCHEQRLCFVLLSVSGKKLLLHVHWAVVCWRVYQSFYFILTCFVWWRFFRCMGSSMNRWEMSTSNTISVYNCYIHHSTRNRVHLKQRWSNITHCYSLCDCGPLDLCSQRMCINTWAVHYPEQSHRVHHWKTDASMNIPLV